MTVSGQLAVLNDRVVACRKCPRLARYREKVAREKRRMFREWDYWGKPVPGFGDPRAKLLVLGLAPAAHGTNRTGRMFTGDRSGDFLYAALYRAGFANQPTSTHRADGLRLKNCYITAGVRCCPPANKPTREEQANCRPYLEEELRLLKNLRAVLALGQIAHNTFLRLLRDYGCIETLAAYRFRHGVHYGLPLPIAVGGGPSTSLRAGKARPYPNRMVGLFDSYHPSQQNTQTGRLTPAMFDRVLRQIRRYL
jgi:uracil-DNA glycosylase family 4